MFLFFFAIGVGGGMLMPGIFGHTEWMQIAGGTVVGVFGVCFVASVVSYFYFGSKITAITESTDLPKYDLDITKQKIYECACKYIDKHITNT